MQSRREKARRLGGENAFHSRILVSKWDKVIRGVVMEVFLCLVLILPDDMREKKVCANQGRASKARD